MARKIDYSLTDKQSTAFHLLTDKRDAAVLFGGAKGGGKSMFLCLWVVIWCRYLIKLWGLKDGEPPAHPIPIGFIGRKQSVDFKSTTLETFKRVIPADAYRIKESDQEIIIDDLVKVEYGGLDDQDKINKFNSAELAFFAIDQAEETERTNVDVLQAALRLTVKGITPPYKQLYTANPADCWLKEDFIDNRAEGKYYVPALYTDNRHLPENYGKTLDAAFKYNQALLNAYKFGDWHALQGSNALISSIMLMALKGINHRPTLTRRIISCDPSLGGDECVIYSIENRKIIEAKIMFERDQMKIAGEMLVAARKLSTHNYAADVTGGLGTAILDRIREVDEDANCNYVNASDAATDKIRFYNRRAECAWYTMERIQDKEIPYPEDEELRRQLTNYKFKVVNSNGLIQLLPKSDMKKILGRSPDQGDAFLLGIWAHDQTEPVRAKDAWRQDFGEVEISLGADSAMTA